MFARLYLMKALQQVSYEYWAVKVMSQTCRDCLCLINSSVQITMSNQRKTGKLKSVNGNKTFMEAHQIEPMTVLMNRYSYICCYLSCTVFGPDKGSASKTFGLLNFLISSFSFRLRNPNTVI